jgi:hypothetical protein
VKLPAPAYGKQAQGGASGKCRYDYRVGFSPRLQGGASSRLASDTLGVMVCSAGLRIMHRLKLGGWGEVTQFFKIPAGTPVVRAFEGFDVLLCRLASVGFGSEASRCFCFERLSIFTRPMTIHVLAAERMFTEILWV